MACRPKSQMKTYVLEYYSLPSSFFAFYREGSRILRTIGYKQVLYVTHHIKTGQLLVECFQDITPFVWEKTKKIKRN